MTADVIHRIVWLDPGGTTGWAYWQDEPLIGVDDTSMWSHFSCGQIADPEHHEQLYNWLCFLQTQKFEVGSESFEFRQGKDEWQRMGIELISREYIGVAKLFVKQRNPDQPKLYQQTAGAAKGFIPDKAKNGLEANAKLKAMGLYIPGKPHAMDAMRHLITFLVQKRRRNDLIQSWRNL